MKKYDVIVVGAGFAGLYMLKRLRDQGFSVLVLEAGDDIGGTAVARRDHDISERARIGETPRDAHGALVVALPDAPGRHFLVLAR